MHNRNKLITLFAGNLATIVVHTILEEALSDENLRKYYTKEIKLSFTIAKKYREQIHPLDRELPETKEIMERVCNLVRSELMSRIRKGYAGIDLEKISTTVQEILGALQHTSVRKHLESNEHRKK
ncbi:hypothetical protein J4457_03130 [Candidatus Woesearchaeota archaeon]|nr:hypothetical protein [Candidatus Woesearchaeota archaeon]